MKNRIRWLCVCLAVLLCPYISVAEEATPRLIIAVEYEANACNIAAEEAFLKIHPDAVIEYRKYTTEQFSAMAMTGEMDFDLAILDAETVNRMTQKGYVETLDEAIGLTEYPDKLIDIEKWVTLDGKMFMIPMSISQSIWVWNDLVARKCGIEFPAKDGVWTWEEYCELSKKFPMDTDGDGEPDAYFKGGASYMAAPLLVNQDADMFLNYIEIYPQEMDRFMDEYFDLFTESFTSPGLLPQDQNASVLIERWSVGTPMKAPGIMLPKPVFDSENPLYPAEIEGCFKAKNAPHSELANDFLNVLLSDEVLYTYVTNDEVSFVTKEPPTKRITNYDRRMAFKTCAFEDVNGIQTYCVQSGRTVKTTVAGISKSRYDTAQAYRSQISLNEFTGGRDFFDAMWINLQEWYVGHVNKDELKENVQYLIDMTLGE